MTTNVPTSPGDAAGGNSQGIYLRLLLVVSVISGFLSICILVAVAWIGGAGLVERITERDKESPPVVLLVMPGSEVGAAVVTGSGLDVLTNTVVFSSAPALPPVAPSAGVAAAAPPPAEPYTSPPLYSPSPAAALSPADLAPLYIPPVEPAPPIYIPPPEPVTGPPSYYPVYVPAALPPFVPHVVRPANPVANIVADLRAGPGWEYEIVGRVPAGQELQVVAHSADGRWLQLDFGAWIAAEFVSGTRYAPPDALPWTDAWLETPYWPAFPYPCPCDWGHGTVCDDF
ncbi:MAG: SH3 domain-containing protein, partial [Caldilineaceae bacterium]|nr:SH3 domain-containing protein [Caldilineaceae bacterium]